VFADNESATDSSFIGTDTSLIVKNGYGYTGPTSVSGGGSTTPGVARVDINPSTQKCKVIWVSDERAGTAFGKLSLSKGLVYLYTKDPTTDGTDLYDFTTLGFGTGATISKVLAGTGTQYDGHYGAITLSPAGVEYLDVLKGIVALR